MKKSKLLGVAGHLAIGLGTTALFSNDQKAISKKARELSAVLKKIKRENIA